MVTKNFRLMVGADLITGGRTTSGTINGLKDAMKKMKASDGLIYTPADTSYCLADTFSKKSEIVNMNDDVFGANKVGISLIINGDASEPSPDEYFMEAVELQTSVNNLIIDSISESYMYFVSKAFTNDTSEDVTIRSVGVIAGIRCSDSEGGTKLKSYLLYRERLDSSITIKPGETCTFAVAIK